MNYLPKKIVLPFWGVLLLGAALLLGSSLLGSALLGAAPAQAAQSSRQWANWNEIASAMEDSLKQAYQAYQANDVQGAKDWVNDAYFGHYEKYGFERTVLSHISGKRAATTEYQFALIKKMMNEGESLQAVGDALQVLVRMLKEDADALDGNVESALGVFLASLLIILREGFEAILVIAAIVAYLLRSGLAHLSRIVYASALAALAASVLAALAMQYLFNISGANQEIIEGAAMLLAAVVLFFVSNWMFSKAQAQAWQQYIENKVAGAVQTGSAFALGAAAFLAVFREGAETILFYQAMLADVDEYVNMIWLGIAVGAVALTVIFMVVRYGSLRLPIRPFFIGTSILMYLMAIAFAGGGIKELQEADLVGVTPLAWMGTIDILGIYPTWETLSPQLILLLLVACSIFYYRVKNRHAGLDMTGKQG
jgi:high-affinity iron transporter